MRTSLYEIEHQVGVGEVLEELRARIASAAGVTLIGNRLTVRFELEGELVDAHMIIESVTTVQNARYERIHGDAEWCSDTC